MSGTRYSVQGGAAPSVSCNPSASASDSYTLYTDLVTHASVAYTAAAYPVTIDLAGTTPVNGAQEALTGQQIKATLDINGAPGTLSNYKWSTGGNTFETYDTDAPDALHTTQLVPLSNADKAATQFSFNDETNSDTVTVMCTATVTFPDGTTGTVTASSAPVTFLQPTANWVVNQWAAYPAYFDDGSQDSPSTYTFGAHVYWYPITISVPAPFTGGSACLAQVGQFLRTNTGTNTMTDASALWQNLYVTGGYPSTTYLTSDPLGLDSQFPYAYAFAVGGTATAPTLTPISGAEWSVGQNVASGDFPKQGEDPANWDANDAVNISWNAATANDTINTWLMYQPPGGSIWVPLQRLGWAWSGHAAYGASTPTGWSAIGPTPPASHGSQTSTPPAWSVVVPAPLTYP